MATKATAASSINVALTAPDEAGQGAALVKQAQGIVIRDLASQQFCRDFLKGAKALKKKIADHYAAIKGPLNAARTTVLDMEKRDLAPVELAISVAEQVDVEYTRQRQRIEAAEAEARRRAAEFEERKRREKEAAQAEAAALKLEAASDELSDRERLFVEFCGRVVSAHRTPDYLVAAAKFAGYKDPLVQAGRLTESRKVREALIAADKAVAIRKEAAAKAAAPINVAVPVVASQVAEGGIRTYYGCESFNTPELLSALAVASMEGANLQLLADIDRYLKPALLTLMSAQARELKELFPKAWPMCTLAKRDGSVSR